MLTGTQIEKQTKVSAIYSTKKGGLAGAP